MTFSNDTQQLSALSNILEKIDDRLEKAQGFDDLIVDCLDTDGNVISVLFGDPDLCTNCGTFGGHQIHCEGYHV